MSFQTHPNVARTRRSGWGTRQAVRGRKISLVRDIPSRIGVLRLVRRTPHVAQDDKISFEVLYGSRSKFSARASDRRSVCWANVVDLRWCDGYSPTRIVPGGDGVF